MRGCNIGSKNSSGIPKFPVWQFLLAFISTFLKNRANWSLIFCYVFYIVDYCRNSCDILPQLQIHATSIHCRVQIILLVFMNCVILWKFRQVSKWNSAWAVWFTDCKNRSILCIQFWIQNLGFQEYWHAILRTPNGVFVMLKNLS